MYFQSTHKCGLYLFKFVSLYWDIHFLPSVFVLICSQDSRCVLVAIMNVAQDVFRDPDGLTEIYLSGPVFHQKRYTPSSPSQLALVSIFPLQWSIHTEDIIVPSKLSSLSGFSRSVNDTTILSHSTCYYPSPPLPSQSLESSLRTSFSLYIELGAMSIEWWFPPT